MLYAVQVQKLRETMDPALRLNLTSFAADQSRTQRLITGQEMLLEYSLVIIVVGCFVLVSLTSKLAREFGALEDRVSWT